MVRKNTGVTLTPAGQLLLSRSESITREMKNMVNEISGMSSEAVVEVSFGFPFIDWFYFLCQVKDFSYSFGMGGEISVNKCE